MGAFGAVLLAKIALLGPEGSPVIARVQRNLGDEEIVAGVAVSCTRSAIEDAAKSLEGNTIICTDGDVVSVWKVELDGVKLVDAVPIADNDDRTLEIIAARVTLAARGAPPKQAGGSVTIIAHPDGSQEPEAVKPPPPKPRIAPRLVLSAGPTLFGSSDGGSLGFQVQGEIGLGRFVAVTPWIGVVPAPRHIEQTVGTAEYRPTLFGCGVNFPFLGPSEPIVPRLGAGYAMLWVRTWPDKVKAGGVPNESEDLFAPVMYVTASASVRIADPIRIVVEGMAGFSSSEVDIRVAGNVAARWGDPLASIGIRAEYVLR